MDYINPNIYLTGSKRLPCLNVDIGELDQEIIDGLKSTADAAIGFAGGYDADTGDLCALALSTQKRILTLSFLDTTTTDGPSILAESILLDPGLKKYAFNAPRLITSLASLLPALRSNEVYDLIASGKFKPHTTAAVSSILGANVINEENVIEVFSSEICDQDDLKHTFNMTMRAWAACHIVNKRGSLPRFKTVLPFDTSLLTDDVRFPVPFIICCRLLWL